MASTTTGAPAALLAAARGGDEHAYRSLVEPHSRELHAHAYRMLGSVHDAEDAIQDAMLRAWRGLPKFDGRSSLRAWLYKIATNTCLDTISRRGKRALPIDHVAAAELGESPGRPLIESVWIEPCDDAALGLGDGRAAPEARYEQRESVELAFIAALQHLPANQRAVLILREVLGFSAQETAELLETTVASVNSAMQRARKTIEEKLPSQSQQKTLRAIGDERMRAGRRGLHGRDGARRRRGRRGDARRGRGLVDAADVDVVPRPRRRCACSCIMGPLSGAWRWAHRPAFANGQPAIGAYTWREDEGCYRPFALDVLTLSADGSKIAQVTSFIARSGESLTPEELARFPDEQVAEAKVASIFTRVGLPERLD